MKDDPARAERLATALRANLARRKTRERAEGVGAENQPSVPDLDRAHEHGSDR